MRVMLLNRLCIVGCLVFLGATPRGEAAEPKVSAPLFDNLGHLHHPVTTRSALAQRYFNQGMVLLYGFNHAEAIRSFQAVARLDPDCAMAHWGIAYAYGPNINQPMGPEAVPLAWAALQEARRLRPHASPREQAYIDALATRYQPEPGADRAPLDRAYAEAMREVARQFPDDLDAATLFVEAVLDTMPWDYWQPDLRPKLATQEIIAVLRNVLRRDPDHPGANHFFIHAIEAGPTPEDALASADRLRALELGAGHLVHMPSHIYLRVGQYEDAITANAIASKLDRRYLAQCRAQGYYPATYYPHNLHFLWFANLVTGRTRDSVSVARRIVELEADARCGPSALVEATRLRHLPVLTLARFGRWDELEREVQPGADFPMDLAMWHYARGLGASARRDGEAASRHLAALRRLAGQEETKRLDSPAFPATKVLAVAEAVLAGKVALVRGETERGLDYLRKAVEREEEIPYMEPPFWHAPTRQTLGAALLASDRAVDAESVFRADLARHPRNGWSLHGLRESLQRQGRAEAAENVRREFAISWKHADGPISLEWY